MRHYPTEKEVYEYNLKEINKRGFGVLLVHSRRGINDPAWTTVYLVGEEYTNLLLAIAPTGLPTDMADEHREELLLDIREEHDTALASGRFLQLRALNIGEKEIDVSLRLYLPQVFPALIGVHLYRVDHEEFDLPVEYLTEIEEATRQQYGKSLPNFLAQRTCILLTPVAEASNEYLQFQKLLIPLNHS